MNNIVTEFDLVVIGGGATGSGVALDATLRGFKTLIIDKNDFAQGTSSRSTKLVHGGVRYLEKAVKKLDINQYRLVKEGLKERHRLLGNASHLSKSITLVTPLYRWYEIPYMYIGLALYDLISGKKRLGRSQIVSKGKIIDIFPSVKKEGLKGGVRYHDGLFNDSRMVISLLQSALQEGCEVRNYTEIIGFLYDDKGTIKGIRLQDALNGDKYEVDTNIVVNATGPFVDIVRKLDEKNIDKLVEVSSGVHIVLDKKFLPSDEGIMIPKTEDGRVLFMLPYLGKCLVGTTDESAKLEGNPKVSQADIDYVLRHIKKYFDVEVKRSDVLSSWSGLRPLVIKQNIAKTEELVREHIIEESKSGLISIVGGKWTTYRKMAEDVLDYIAKRENRKNLHKCKTKEYKLVGNRKNRVKVKERLDKLEIDKDIKEHLLSHYGDCTLDVLEYIEEFGTSRVHANYLCLEAEVYYSVDWEFTRKPLDFLQRRSGLGFIDKSATIESLERVASILKDKLKWSDDEYVLYLKEARSLLQ